VAQDVAIFDDAAARRMLERLNKRIKEVEGGGKIFLDLASAMVFRDLVQHFEQEKGSEGPWKAWSDFYAQKMERLGKGGNKILQDSGRLRQGLIPIQSGRNVRKVPEGILWFNPAKTKGGFPYALAHDEGGEKLPKRDFMWLSASARENIAQKTLAFIMEE
jgi:phage gpG-like protein